MNIIVLGCGMQGSVIAKDLAKTGHQVTGLDFNPKNLEQLKKIPNIKTKRFDVTNQSELVKLLKKFDIVVGALPSGLGFYSMKCAIAAGVDMVDISYLPEDPFRLDKSAKRKKIKIVPDAGFAPGLSNILVGEAYAKLKPIDTIRILAGGIPQKPVPPFNYRITWSVTDLIEEYLRPARIRKNFRTVKVKALSDIEEFELKRIGRLECFYTDGLRTLLRTLQDVRWIEEKTIRYPGHAVIFRAMIDRGFFSEKPFKIGKYYLKPKDIFLRVLQKELAKGSKKDMTILLIEVYPSPIRRKRRERFRKYRCIDYYDEKNKITAMARMTGYTCSVITQLIKDYPGYGIIPPEYLGMNEGLCGRIKKGLKERGIEIKVSKKY